ncbi:MAG: hypothetical protein JXR23_10475 [Pontiellaceae bacterium]|nr:hypothetical protein [Pontiellaceae bacterium]
MHRIKLDIPDDAREFFIKRAEAMNLNLDVYLSRILTEYVADIKRREK